MSSLMVNAMMVKRTNGILVFTAIFLLLHRAAFGNDGLDEQTSGVAVAKSILFGSESAKDIPESAKFDYLGEIEKIENSRFVRVTYSQMSAWRKEQFVQGVNEWIRRFLEQDFRTEIIIKSHTAQCLYPIAQLFLVPPTNSDKTVLKKAHTQLVELENIVQEKVRNKVNAFSESLRKQHPILGEDFVLELEDLNRRFRCAFQMEDDLNPFQRIPIADADFEKLKMQVSAFMEKGQIALWETEKEDITTVGNL
ncbi:hypothetical protein FACS1894189_7740 [Planctomycetales bacterium]|nr:hypothetical protein FACS1894189_7740 [Planctomycetales bacterium]